MKRWGGIASTAARRFGEQIGHRVALRDFEPGDAAVFQSYRADPRYLRYQPPGAGAPEQARALLERFAAAARRRPRRDFDLAIAALPARALIGCCRLSGAGLPAGCAEYGVELSPPQWGRGLAAEASRLLLGLGFESLALREIRCVTVTENRRVAGLLRRLGFAERGRRRAGAWADEKGWSLTDWSLTRDAWQARAADRRQRRADAE